MQTLKTMALGIGVLLGVFFSSHLYADPTPCDACESLANEKCTSKHLSNQLNCKKNICHLTSSCHGCKFCSEISCELCKEDIERCASKCQFYPGCYPLLKCIKGWVNPLKHYPGCKSLLQCLQGWGNCKADCKKQICENEDSCSDCGFCQ